jgi:hypothetical protein
MNGENMLGLIVTKVSLASNLYGVKKRHGSSIHNLQIHPPIHLHKGQAISASYSKLIDGNKRSHFINNNSNINSISYCVQCFNIAWNYLTFWTDLASE